ncbi:MAG: SufD family Fe-S cluster assembly protein [Clostridia bacterium]|nr:SufD family Fe-S cluster assembly protein [Clostridia bacterium]
MLNKDQLELLNEIAGITCNPGGAINIRANGQLAERNVTENINIRTKEDKPGIDIIVKAGTKGETVYIPVVIDESGMTDVVYNDFFIGEDADVTIVAGCGIHNCGEHDSQHDGIHRFFLEKNAHIRYVENHYGSGDGNGKRILNPVTEVYQEEGSSCEMEMVQIKGVDSTVRTTKDKNKKDAKLVVRERLMTHGSQIAESNYVTVLEGENSSADVVSRSVARDRSYQKYVSRIVGNAACYGHTECDAILMDSARVLAVPELDAACIDASLVHEAAIGKIAGDQLIKLMTLGLTPEEAEEKIIEGFLG